MDKAPHHDKVSFIEGAMSCKKEGFITIRYNDLRNLTANLLTEACKDVDIEPQLVHVTGETFNSRTANTKIQYNIMKQV